NVVIDRQCPRLLPGNTIQPCPLMHQSEFAQRGRGQVACLAALFDERDSLQVALGAGGADGLRLPGGGRDDRGPRNQQHPMHRVLPRWSPASRQRAEAGAFTLRVPGALGLRRQTVGQERTRATKNFQNRFGPEAPSLRLLRTYSPTPRSRSW